MPKINFTSPTLAEVMRSCLLRAGLSRAAGVSDLVLGNPKGWLGTAYHEVLAKLTRHEPAGEALNEVVLGLWDQAIARQYERASHHPLDRRFGSQDYWPGYYMARASVLLRAHDLARTEIDATAPTHAESAPNVTIDVRERELAAFNGRLVGRPDLIRDGVIVDYKSGEIMEHEDEAGPDVVRRAYVRQLQIYGYLVRAVLGWWPRQGQLLPPVGIGVKLELEPRECQREAEMAVALLDTYAARAKEEAPTELGSPSPSVCNWCSFKLLCPSLWQHADSSWSGQTAGASIEGAVVETPRSIHAGSAFALAIDVQAGTERPCRTEIAPFNPAIHPIVPTLVSGDRVRCVDLRRRPDGALLPGYRTVIARLNEIPTFCNK